jgi:hypothetical protein
MFSLPRSQAGVPGWPSFRSAVRAAQGQFLKTFEGPDNSANQPFIICIDHAQKMLAAHDAACAGLATRLQIFRIEAAIVCLLCRGLRIDLEDLSSIHRGFQVRQPQMQLLGAPDLTCGLAAIQSFASEATTQPETYRGLNFGAASNLANLARQALTDYWRASGYPHVPWILPEQDEGRVDVEAIRGTHQPDDLCFFILPPGQSIPQFDKRPAGDEHVDIWDIWWFEQLRRFPSNTRVWRGERLWVPLRELVRDLGRKIYKDS